MAHKISIIIIILQMDLVEDYDDLIDRHYANVQEYHRIEPLESTANNRLFQARYRFNKFNFGKLAECKHCGLCDQAASDVKNTRLWV